MMQYLHKNVESASNKTPIVVLTANAVAGAREEYINKGLMIICRSQLMQMSCKKY